MYNLVIMDAKMEYELNDNNFYDNTTTFFCSILSKDYKFVSKHFSF